MKLATLKTAGRDGALVVVGRDLRACQRVPKIAATLQFALDNWAGVGLAAIEAHRARAPETGRFCHGDAPTIADCCLVPQVFNARRFEVDLAPFPTVARIDAACAELPAFAAAHPSRQPDAE
jgi:glutathione S-transferase